MTNTQANSDLSVELVASRVLIGTLKSLIDLDIYGPAGERVETAFMAYDAALGLSPDEVPS